MEKEPITVTGLEKLKIELDELKNIKRPKIVEAIAEARSHGDLKENAEYHAAKEEQAKIEGRIISINDSIARANVIDVTALEKKDVNLSERVLREHLGKLMTYVAPLEKDHPEYFLLK